MNKPLAIAYKPFRAMNMKANTSKEKSYYTQGQRFAARILFILWLLASSSPEGILAAPKGQPVMTPATTTSPGDPSLASAPPTLPPGGILPLPPDAPGSFWSDGIANSPAIDAALQRQRPSNLFARMRDRLASRLWRPRPQEAPRTPAGPIAEGVDSSPAAPVDPPQDQASELTKKLVSLYSADDKLPKLIEDDDIPEQDIDQYYVRLQAVVQEQAAGAESAAARDKVVGEKRAIQIEEIFDELDKEGGEPIGKVLLLGGAGIGKTTLMHHISHQWAQGRLWKGQYAYLFRVRLKELLNHSWQSGCNPDDLDEHPLACFIHHCLRNQRSQLPLPRSQRKTFKLCSLEEIKNLLEDSASQPSVLLLVDGYDEIASQRQQGIIKDIVDSILEQERAIMTSRPNAADKKLRSSFDRQVENQGLDRAGIDQYIDLQFGEEQAGQDLKDFLTKNRQILGMCEVPINTALLCIVWRDPEIRERLQKQTGEDLKLGELYQELVVWLGKRYMKKFKDANHDNLDEQFILSHPVVKTLKEVAYTNFTGAGKEQVAGTLGIAGKDVVREALKQATTIESVYQYGLLRAEGRGEKLKDKTHYFIHLTFQEYLTALHLSEALSQGEGVREVATHLAEHRNEPRYLMTLKFLAGLVSKSNDQELVQRFWEAVSCNVEGVLELGVASKVGLLMHLMAQSTIKGELDARIPNREKLQELVDNELVTDLARWQEQIIASGYQSATLVRKLCEVIYQEQPEDISELSAALEIGLALGSKVVEAEQPLAGRLEDLLDSPVWQVQALAAAKLAQVLDDKVDPAQVIRLPGKLVGRYEVANTRQGALAGIQRLAWLQADIVVEELRKIVSQGSAGNRDTVLRLAMELAAGSSKQLAKKLSDLGQAWCKSTYPEVRSSALTLMEKLLSIDAGLATELLEAAKTGFKDGDDPWGSVRSSALTLMEKLLSKDAGLAPQCLEAAKTRVKDEFWSVRLRALSLMEHLLSIDAGLATECLEAAKTGLKDSSSDVQDSALSLIDKLLLINAGLATECLEVAKTGFKDWNSDVRSSALSLMEHLLSKDAGLATECLEVAKTGFKDADRDVRSSALSLIDKLLAIDAGLAIECLEAAKTGIKDAESYVRYSALSLMEHLLAKDAGLATECLEAAKTGIKDSSSAMRSSALSLMAQLLSIDAGLATDLLEAAKTGVKDADRDVRSSALSLMEKLLSIDAGLAPQCLEAAKTETKDQSWRVRGSALFLMEKLLSIDGGLAPQFLEPAKTGLKDEDPWVQSSTPYLIDKLLSIDAGLASQFLEAAKTGLKDSDRGVLSIALDLIDKLLSIDAGLAPQFLEPAKTGLKDEDWYVRSSALSLMEKLLTIDGGLAPQFLEAAKTGFKDADSDVRSSALSLMEQLLTIDGGLAPQFLEAVKTGGMDEEWRVRSSALSLMEQLLAIDAGLAPQFLEAAKTGVKDVDRDVRSGAFTLMEKLLSIDAELAPDLLEAAKTGLKDSAWQVRQRALTLMEQLLTIDAGLASQFLETAKTGLKDAESDVRSSALTLMEQLLAKDAGLASQFLETAKTGLKDAESDVRSSALTLMEQLLAKDAGLATELLEAAKTGLKDAAWPVRQSALTLMEKLLSIDAGLAPQFLEAAKTGLKDEDWQVRQRALTLMAKLLAIDAGLATELLEAAKTGLKDKNVNVKWEAFELLRKLAETLSKPEIERDALNQLKAQLEKETWRITKSALQTALTFTKLIPASAQHWLELVPYGLRDEDSETQEAAISLGVELAFHLPDEAIPMLLKDPESPAVRDKAKEHFTRRLQDKTVPYSPQDILVLDQLLLHSATDSELDKALQSAVTQKLLELAPQVAKEAGLEYLNQNFDTLRPGTAITAFLKKVMHQTLADNVIDDLEAKLITKCILQHGITATIAPRQRLFVLEDSRYQLKDSSEASLQQIVNRVIEASETELARQYKAHQPLFKNTGLGLPIAASDVPRAGSVVNNADLTTNTWHLSIMHLSDHHQQAPQETFLLLEQRNYVGEHIIKKITYDQGQYTLAYDKALNPNAIDTTLRKELFGPMEYERTKPRYYATCYTLSNQAVQELLGKINQQAGEPDQNAYQALHQLALVACEADQDTAKAEQLALEWGAYVPSAQELKKVDLLQLSQDQAEQVRRDSLAIETKEEVTALGKRVESHENTLDVTGITSKAAITKKLEALKANHPKLYAYCHTFIWTMSRYIAANSIASTDMFSQELDRSTKEAVGMGLLQAGIAGAESVPVVGDFAGLLGKLIDVAYKEVKIARQENKAAVLNRIIQEHHLFLADADLTISRAGLLIVEQQKEKILSPPERKSTLEKLLGIRIEDFKHTIERLKHTMLRTYELPQSPQAGLAIEDVLLLLVRMYKEHKTLKEQGGELYEQLAALVCTGSLPDLLSQSTAATQEDAAIAPAESALKAPAINPGVTREDLAQAERALTARASKKDTINKLKKKAGEGSWEATRMKRGKECEEFFEEACVRGYIADSQPGVAVSDKQIEAMRMVLFRHMCEGIRDSGQQSLACARKFATEYPDLVEKLAKEYPTYFVSKAIARACITDPSLADEVVSHLLS